MKKTAADAKKPLKGVRISRVSVAMIAASCVLYVLLTLTASHLAKTLADTYQAMDDFYVSTQGEALFLAASDDLTEQARLYIVLGDRAYIERYCEKIGEARQLEAGLSDTLEQYELVGQLQADARAALETSRALAGRELYAMRLAAEARGEAALLPQAVREPALTAEDAALSPEEMLEKAHELVFGEAYQADKAQIEASVLAMRNSVDDNLKQRMVAGYKSFQTAKTAHYILTGIHFADIMVCFLFIILLVVLPLWSFSRRMKAGEPLQVVGAYECKYLARSYNVMLERDAVHKEILRRQAEHDALTGLLNRGAFDGLKQALHTKGGPLGLLIVDVDKFKQVNDGYGHEMGDRVLKKVADQLSGSFRATDYPARIGGDEFAVILTDARPEQESAILAKIEAINETLTHPDDGTPVVSLSVGGAFSDDGFTDSLYKHADLALYEVKEHGRRGCRFYSGAVEQHQSSCENKMIK